MQRGSLLIALAVSGCTFERADAVADDDPAMPPAAGGCTAPSSLADDLRLCLEFEDALPMKIALDGSGLNHDASVVAVSGVSRTPPGSAAEQAARLTGASQLHVLETPDLDLVDEVTVEMYVAMDPIAPLRRYWMIDNNGQYSMSYGTDGEVMCGINGLAATVDSGPVVEIRDTGWHHVACTYDRTELRVYVDGALADCKEEHAQLAASAGGTTIGARTGGFDTDRFLGSLDDIRVYARALTPQEICSAAGKAGCVSTCPPKDGRGMDGEDDPR